MPFFQEGEMWLAIISNDSAEKKIVFPLSLLTFSFSAVSSTVVTEDVLTIYLSYLF